MSGTKLARQADIHALYSDHQGWLLGWLRRKLGNHHDAADISHDTFLRLISGHRDTSRLGDEPRALLTHIARCLVIDHWRRRDVEQAYLDSIAHLPACEAPSPETRWLILEALYRIDTMLRDLPALTRRIFLLSQLDGLKYQDIAERMAVSLPTVKRHMRKAFLACLSLD
ncbi:ECF subfamily RNA polymerase sigma-24 factor [Alcanivorax xiamenensis]|uniref:ECF subfamily RNA polymerase sigma-24 factor n=1 Tax=Alcanivorax xiamenensis TaxID=1177156 RepID=A0ABQ6Y4L3_9GAMM|nr:MULTISPECIES: sigma-70 family RNA polymerase sigma factor [Alcanivorax]KAF0804158.1 ECF subfamily RNA polymerase sigma-24 factor [Alcanivorax xiamenensis]